MDPINLSLQGFRSFNQKQVFSFPTDPGFYFITGKNLLEPELEANGAGKSSLWDGLVWVLYGKTTRNLRAGDVKTWNSKVKCAGEFEFKQNDNFYRLVRTWNPNSLQLSVNNGDLNTVKQEEIDDLVGLQFEEFLNSIVFGQFRSAFFDLLPSKKSELLASILNLDVWMEYSDEAKSQKSDLEADFRDTKSLADHQEGKIQALKELDFNSKIAVWEEEKEQKIIKIKENLAELSKKGAGLKTNSEDHLQKRDQIDEDLKVVEQELEEIKVLDKEINTEISEINLKKRGLTVKIELIDKDLDKFATLSDKCPYCDQKVNPAHLRSEKTKLADKKAKLMEELVELELEFSELEESLSEIAEAKREVKLIFNDITRDKSRIETNIRLLKQETLDIMSQLQRGRVQITDLEGEQNPYVAAKTDNEMAIKILENDHTKTLKELEGIEESINLVAYWIKGFKEVRLFVISEILTQLELEVNNTLIQLGLKDWRIEFAVDKETKSGTIQKGFHVMIYSPYNEAPVAWESWSGGESQRLRLAGTLGLASLILARNGVSSWLEVFDEPSQFLSEAGIEDLLETLEMRARDLDKQIWLIDHRNLNTLAFDGIFTVVKDKTGSQIKKGLI